MATVSSPVVSSQVEADRLYAELQQDLGERARRARSLQDVEVIARDVRLLKLHPPRTIDIVASADADGADFVEHGFATEGGFIGTEDARVICEHHDSLTPWPCAELLPLVRIVRPAALARS